MRVRYVGPSGSGVEVIHPDPAQPDANTTTVCPPGEPVDLPDEMAVSQMATGAFEPVDKAAETALRRHQRQAAKAHEAAGEDTAAAAAGGETAETEEG